MSALPALEEARGSLRIAQQPTRKSLGRLRSLREEFLADPATTDLSGVRDVIARSWRRSLACKVDPGSIHAEVRDPQIDGPLLRIAMPAVERLETIARGTGVGVILADSRGTIAAMRGDREILAWADARMAAVGSHVPEDLAGTNSDGTALEERTTVQVWGPEHYADGLQDTFCTSVPIFDALRGRIAAVLTLMVPERIALDADPGSWALVVEGAAAEISRAAAARHAHREHALLQAYVRESRMRGAEAVLAIDERTTIASNRAQQLLTPDDYAVLSGYAREAVSLGGNLERMVSLAGDRIIKLTAKPVVSDGDVVGAVVRLREQAEPDTSSGRTSAAAKAFPALVGDSAVIAGVRTAATSAIQRSTVVCVTGERGTGRAHLARLVAEAQWGTPRVIECDPGRRETEQELGVLREALESAQPILCLHVDQLPVQLVAQSRDLLRKAAARGRLFVTAYQPTDDLLDVLSAGTPQEIRMPPLRSRRDDIPLLVSHFLSSERGDRSLKPSGTLLHALTQAEWPGNVAALRDLVLSAARSARSGALSLTDLSEHQQKTIARGRLTRLEAAELEQIRHGLVESRGNRVRAAELLGIGRSTLYRKIDSYTRRGFDLGTRGCP